MPETIQLHGETIPTDGAAILYPREPGQPQTLILSWIPLNGSPIESEGELLISGAAKVAAALQVIQGTGIALINA